jgi:hypothetical protein
MKFKLGVLFAGGLVMGAVFADATTAEAVWSVQNHAFACHSSALPNDNGFKAQSGPASIPALCPGFRMQPNGGSLMRRQNTTVVEVGWSVPSGATATARACIVDATGTAGGCAASATSRSGAFSGFTSLDATNLAFWTGGTIGGVFDQYDAPYILVDLPTNARLGSYYIEGS